MSTPTIPVRSKKASEALNVKLDLRGRLDSGESLDGTPTIVESGTSDLTLASKSVSSTALTINGASVPPGEAVTFKVSGGTAGTTYTIDITVDTDASPIQQIKESISLEVVAD